MQLTSTNEAICGGAVLAAVPPNWRGRGRGRASIIADPKGLQCQHDAHQCDAHQQQREQHRAPLVIIAQGAACEDLVGPLLEQVEGVKHEADAHRGDDRARDLAGPGG